MISFNPVVAFVENVGALKVFVIAVFAFVSPSTSTVILSVVNVLFAIPVKYLSVAINSAVTFLLVLSIFIFSTFQTGSTTSTISSLLCPSSVDGSSIPIVIVFAIFLFPDLSVIISAGKAIFITPLYWLPSPWSKFFITNWYLSPTFVSVTPFTVAVKSDIFVSVFVASVGVSPPISIPIFSALVSVVSADVLKYLSATSNITVTVFVPWSTTVSAYSYVNSGFIVSANIFPVVFASYNLSSPTSICCVVFDESTYSAKLPFPSIISISPLEFTWVPYISFNLPFANCNDIFPLHSLNFLIFPSASFCLIPWSKSVSFIVYVTSVFPVVEFVLVVALTNCFVILSAFSPFTYTVMSFAVSLFTTSLW